MEKVAGGNGLLNALELLQRAGVAHGMAVADLGCGNAGYFVLQAGTMVGEKGTVYAVDVLQPVLASVTSAVKQAGLHNVQTIWSNLEVYGAAKIRDGSVDVALLINILFQSKKHAEILREVVRLVKKGGKLLVVDWKNIPSPLGPPSTHRVPQETIRMIAQQQGLHETDAFTAGPFHYGLLFTKE